MQLEKYMEVCFVCTGFGLTHNHHKYDCRSYFNSYQTMYFSDVWTMPALDRVTPTWEKYPPPSKITRTHAGRRGAGAWHFVSTGRWGVQILLLQDGAQTDSN